MIVVHRVARQMSSITKWCESFFGHLVFPLRRIANNMSRHKIEMIQNFFQCIFSVRQNFLQNRFIEFQFQGNFSTEMISFQLTQSGSLTQIVEHPTGWHTALIFVVAFGVISSMCNRKSWNSKDKSIRRFDKNNGDANSKICAYFLTLWNSTCAPSAMPSSSRTYCGNDSRTLFNVSS